MNIIQCVNNNKKNLKLNEHGSADEFSSAAQPESIHHQWTQQIRKNRRQLRLPPWIYQQANPQNMRNKTNRPLYKDTTCGQDGEQHPGKTVPIFMENLKIECRSFEKEFWEGKWDGLFMNPSFSFSFLILGPLLASTAPHSFSYTSLSFFQFLKWFWG